MVANKTFVVIQKVPVAWTVSPTHLKNTYTIPEKSVEDQSNITIGNLINFFTLSVDGERALMNSASFSLMKLTSYRFGILVYCTSRSSWSRTRLLLGGVDFPEWLEKKPWLQRVLMSLSFRFLTVWISNQFKIFSSNWESSSSSLHDESKCSLPFVHKVGTCSEKGSEEKEYDRLCFQNRLQSLTIFLFNYFFICLQNCQSAS